MTQLPAPGATPAAPPPAEAIPPARPCRRETLGAAVSLRVGFLPSAWRWSSAR